MLIVDDVVINPVEVPMVPARTEKSLSEMGLSVIGADWGESAPATGSEPKTRTITLQLTVREDHEADLPTAAYELQQLVGTMQERETWIRRDPKVGGDFAGSVMYRIKRAPTAEEPQVTLSNLAGWQAGDSPDVTLTMVADFPAYSTEEEESATFSSTTERQLIYTLPASKGTTKGLKRIRITNDNSSGDWRGLIWAEECWDYKPGDPTAEPVYEAQQLTPKGGAEIAVPSAPEIRGVGTLSSGAGAISPGLPVGTAERDLLVMVAESGGPTANTEASVPLTAAGWILAGEQVKGNTRLTILYRIATGGDSTATNDTGDHQMARIIGIKAGTYHTADIFNVKVFGAQGATKAVSIPGEETTRDNCLVIACASGNLPDVAGTGEFGAATNASLTGMTELIDNTVAVGDGGALYAVSGVKATKGAYGATTCTAVTEAERGVISVAINGPTVVQHTGLTAGWLTILGSKTASGHMTHRGGRRLWMRIFDPGAEPGNVQLRLFWRALGSSRWSEDNPIAPTYGVGDYSLVNLGSVLPQAPLTGDERWEFALQARALSGSGSIRIRDVYPLPTEQYAVLSEQSEPAIAGEPMKTPTALEDATGVGTEKWENVNNAKAADGTFATAVIGGATPTTHYLKATNFVFAIPSGATILGIKAAVRCRADAPAFDARVRIVKSGEIKSTQDKAKPQTVEWGTALSRREYGGLNDLWGQAWLPADINSPNFGLAIAATGLGFGGAAYVDVIEMTVAYTETGAEDRVCFAAKALELRSEGAAREASEGGAWGIVIPDGFLPYAAPGGLEGRASRGVLISSQGDLQALVDAGSPNKMSVIVSDRAGFHLARGAA